MNVRTKSYVFEMVLLLALLLALSSSAKILTARQPVVVLSYGLTLGMDADRIPKGLPTVASWSDIHYVGVSSTWTLPQILIEKGQVSAIIANQIELRDGTKIQSGLRKKLLIELLGRPSKINVLAGLECWHFDELNLLVHVNTWNNTAEWFTLSKN